MRHFCSCVIIVSTSNAVWFNIYQGDDINCRRFFHGMIEINPHSSNFIIRAYCDWLYVLGIVGAVATVVLGDVSRSHVRIMHDEHSWTRCNCCLQVMSVDCTYESCTTNHEIYVMSFPLLFLSTSKYFNNHFFVAINICSFYSRIFIIFTFCLSPILVFFTFNFLYA